MGEGPRPGPQTVGNELGRGTALAPAALARRHRAGPACRAWLLFGLTTPNSVPGSQQCHRVSPLQRVSGGQRWPWAGGGHLSQARLQATSPSDRQHAAGQTALLILCHARQLDCPKSVCVSWVCGKCWPAGGVCLRWPGEQSMEWQGGPRTLLMGAATSPAWTP